MCPDGGKVRGTITPDDVIGPEGQGIASGEFDELLAAMRAGVTYANVHTTTFPTGEIRGQIENDHETTTTTATTATTTTSKSARAAGCDPT